MINKAFKKKKEPGSGMGVTALESQFHHLLVMIWGKLLNFSVLHFFIDKMGLMSPSQG